MPFLGDKCPYCGIVLPTDITRRTASRQQCPECKLWLIIDVDDAVLELGNYACRKCGHNTDECQCPPKGYTAEELDGENPYLQWMKDY